MNKLKENGVIGIAALSSPADSAGFELGLSALRSQGFELRIPLDPCAAYGIKDFAFSCGSAAERVRALESLYKDQSVKVIIASRGGYGVMELLEHLNWSVLQKHPKPLVGFSDVSALLAVAAFKYDLPAIHGPSVRSFAKAATVSEAAESMDCLFRLIGGSFVPSYQGAALREGTAYGRLLVGNLTLLRSILGTPWDFSYDGCILVLEEVNDAPFRILRSLMQLKLAGKFQNLAGLAFGDMGSASSEGMTVEEVLDYFIRTELADTSFPIITGLPLGHVDRNLPLPLGVPGTIKNNTLSVVEKSQ